MSEIDARKLFKRSDNNPILTADIWPYPALSVLNSAAVKFNGETLLLVRVEEMSGYSHLTIAKSKDGETDWRIDSDPTLRANIDFGEAIFGIEDPRITWLEDERIYAITYVSFQADGHTGNPPTVSLATTKNFLTFKHLGQPLRPLNDKDAALIPKLIGGRYALIHRPIVEGGEHIWVSFSEDLRLWTDDKVLLPSRPRIWDCDRVGLACPPIETKDGWLLFYHGTRGDIYRIGLALLHLKTLKVIRRSKGCVFFPDKLYEKVGNKPNVVFPCGSIVDWETSKLSLYYGAADISVCLATANLNELLEYLMKCPAE